MWSSFHAIRTDFKAKLGRAFGHAWKKPCSLKFLLSIIHPQFIFLCYSCHIFPHQLNFILDGTAGFSSMIVELYTISQFRLKTFSNPGGMPSWSTALKHFLFELCKWGSKAISLLLFTPCLYPNINCSLLEIKYFEIVEVFLSNLCKLLPELEVSS